MGPACHPLCTIKLSFLGFFLAPDIWSLAFFFRSHGAFETLTKLLAHGSRMSSSTTIKVFFLELFLAPDIWSLAFFLAIPCKMGPACRPLFTKKVSFLGVIFYPNLWILPFF